MIDALARILAPIDRLVAALLRWLVILALAGVLVLIALGILTRSLPVFTMSGYDEVIELLVAWMTFCRRRRLVAGGHALSGRSRRPPALASAHHRARPPGPAADADVRPRLHL